MNLDQDGHDQRLNRDGYRKKFIEDYKLRKDHSDEEFLRALRERYGGPAGNDDSFTRGGARASGDSQERGNKWGDREGDDGDRTEQKIQ